MVRTYAIWSKSGKDDARFIDLRALEIGVRGLVGSSRNSVRVLADEVAYDELDGDLGLSAGRRNRRLRTRKSEEHNKEQHPQLRGTDELKRAHLSDLVMGRVRQSSRYEIGGDAPGRALRENWVPLPNLKNAWSRQMRFKFENVPNLIAVLDRAPHHRCKF